MPRIMELKNGAGWTNPAPQQVGLAKRRAADWRGVRLGCGVPDYQRAAGAQWLINAIPMPLKLGIGAMTDARWKDFFDAMVQAKVYSSDLDYKQAYTLQFVNKGIGKP